MGVLNSLRQLKALSRIILNEHQRKLLDFTGDHSISPLAQPSDLSAQLSVPPLNGSHRDTQNFNMRVDEFMTEYEKQASEKDERVIKLVYT